MRETHLQEIAIDLVKKEAPGERHTCIYVQSIPAPTMPGQHTSGGMWGHILSPQFPAIPDFQSNATPNQRISVAHVIAKAYSRISNGYQSLEDQLKAQHLVLWRFIL